MTGLINLWEQITARLRGGNEYLPQLLLRLLLAWEFWESGITKLNGSNWFTRIQTQFPVPFDSIPSDLSWFLATWLELIGGIALLLGLFTRFFAISLIVLTAVATAAVHWPGEWGSLTELWKGYSISNDGFGNFKLPLIYSVMLMPLLFGGAGKISLDHLLSRVFAGPGQTHPVTDLAAIGLMIASVGVPLMFVMPLLGITLVGLALVSALAGQFLLG